jgi:hypothetical protein
MLCSLLEKMSVEGSSRMLQSPYRICTCLARRRYNDPQYQCIQPRNNKIHFQQSNPSLQGMMRTYFQTMLQPGLNRCLLGSPRTHHCQQRPCTFLVGIPRTLLRLAP